jgi:hypothetical protein
MGNKLSAPTDGDELKSATQVISDVLTENTRDQVCYSGYKWCACWEHQEESDLAEYED